jgi:hypothetical protein
MLSHGYVLNYIKQNLMFPFSFIELTDDQIIEYLTQYTLKEFSHYFPQKKKMSLDLANNPKVPNIENEYYLQEPDGLEIIGVVNIYMPGGDQFLFGQPPIGPMSHLEIRNWALDSAMAMDLKQFSSWNYTFEFTHPNILRISPVHSTTLGFATIEYERMQPTDFSGITNDFQILFSELCLADIMILIGRIRKKYGNDSLKTPFGDIPLTSDIFDEGRDKKRELIEKMTLGSIPSVICEFG